MTLKAQITARIDASGPISIAEYMAECLLHPTLGYYTTRMPFGEAGDFITAPEISQMFGELIGLCLAQSWLDQGRPQSFTLAELGPGRGTLMADLLRATAQVPGFHAAAQITLVEASPRLRAVQKETLAGHKLNFVDSIEALSQSPLYFIANEFFDALPIRQFQRDGTGWRERQVGLNGNDLTFGLAAKLPQPALEHRLADTREGDVVEYAPAVGPILSLLTQRIKDQGGIGLVADYGDWRSIGDTLQAMRSQGYADPLEDPGACDLTAHVDFEALALAAQSATTRLTPQGVFLERLGITARAQSLARNLSGEALASHVAAHRRLTHPEEMGNLFKILGFYPEGASPPPGFDI